MTLDNQLIKKTYYEVFINKHEDVHPIRVLGDLFQEEQQKDIPDLSYIRFAQGEVYFHNNDFEAAIFKWENIVNELAPWAKKNSADAYYKLGLLPTAEEIYKSIETDNLTLTTETAINLFSLYQETGKVEEAVQLIKKTVALNPDYPNVTEMACTFFEDQKDWANAIELAVNEAVRTESLQWFAVLKSYVDKGFTQAMAPEYFSQALKVLYGTSQGQFEGLANSLWNSYKEELSYFSWLKEINQILSGLELDRNGSWHELSLAFKETYLHLINGEFLMKQLQDLIPSLLSNWLRITDTSHALWASTAVLSWNELFPGTVSNSAVQDAEALFGSSAKNVDEFEDCLFLFDTIIEWAKGHDMGQNLRLKWMLEQLTNFDTTYFYIAGLSGSGKSSFVNAVLNKEILPSIPTSTVVVLKDHSELKIKEITDSEILAHTNISDFKERMDRRRNALESILEYKEPIPFLYENKLAFIDTPGLNGNLGDSKEIFRYLPIADAVLFVLDANAPLTNKDLAVLSSLQDQASEIPLHFLLNKKGNNVQEQEALKRIESTKAMIHSYFPAAKILAVSLHANQNPEDVKAASEFLLSLKKGENKKEKRLANLLLFIRNTITLLLQKRIEVENQLIESIHWNEEIVLKLNGAVNQLSDLEVQKVKTITRIYHSIKESMQKEISEEVPKMLKECSKLIKENSNFNNILFELNDEMNKRLQVYLEKTVLPKYYRSMQEWIEQAQTEFEQSQTFLNEMADGFNTLYQEERMNLDCDFKVLDDWHRDTDRLTSRFQLDKVNILLRRTPSQLLLKGAGKLFGAISQNKIMLYNRFKNFIDTEDYTEPTSLIIKQVFQQFELFEKSLERDITMFFKNPAKELNVAVEDGQSEIQTNKERLQKINTNPELFRDPLTLFEIRLRQYEWMTVAGKGMEPILK